MKVGCDTVPDGVYELLIVSFVPENVASRSAPVPVNNGAEAVADFTPVATVTALPLVGKVPALKLPAPQVRVRFSFDTVADSVGNVQDGRVPTESIGVTEVVFTDTETVGADTVPCGI